MFKNNSDQIRLCPTPWQLQGEGYILNCWLNPEFFQQALFFGSAPSFFRSSYSSHVGTLHANSIGTDDELLILDHPLFTQRLLSTIAKNIRAI